MDHIKSMVNGRPLVMFGKSGCPMCHTVSSLLRSFGANLTVYELDRLDNGRMIEAVLVQKMGRPGFPAVYIGQQFIGGSQAVMSLHLQNKLVPMLLAAGAIFMWA